MIYTGEAVPDSWVVDQWYVRNPYLSNLHRSGLLRATTMMALEDLVISVPDRCGRRGAYRSMQCGCLNRPKEVDAMVGKVKVQAPECPRDLCTSLVEGGRGRSQQRSV